MICIFETPVKQKSYCEQVQELFGCKKPSKRKIRKQLREVEINYDAYFPTTTYTFEYSL